MHTAGQKQRGFQDVGGSMGIIYPVILCSEMKKAGRTLLAKHLLYLIRCIHCLGNLTAVGAGSQNTIAGKRDLSIHAISMTGGSK